MSEKKNSSVGLQIDAPSPPPGKFNYDVDLTNLPKWVYNVSVGFLEGFELEMLWFIVDIWYLGSIC